jgi:hypothetical protein
MDYGFQYLSFFVIELSSFNIEGSPLDLISPQVAGSKTGFATVVSNRGWV